MSGRNFKKELKESVLLFDGGMGTMLYNRGIFINRCFDELNISQPQLVKEIHRQYIESGVDVIETNTFGANRFKLAPHNFAAEVEAINYQGAKLAREITGSDVLIAGSIGPLGIRIEPWGPTAVEEARSAFGEQAQALRDGGVDLFIIETFSDLSEIQQAILAVRDVSDLPIIASMTIGDDGNSLYGTAPEAFARRLDQWGADVIGLNCSVGPPLMLEALEKIVQVTAKPISVMPNAGTPRVVDGRNFYLVSKEYMAEYARRFIQTGAKVVGGCCGTTPEHIKAMGGAIRSLVPRRRRKVVPSPVESAPPPTRVSLAEKSALGRALAAGESVTTIEIVPPKGCDPQNVIAMVSELKDHGIRWVNIPDGPRALLRMSAQHLAIRILEQTGVEPLLHYTCRDRNLLGMMSDILGLHANGIRNLLLITGDPPKMGDYPDATAVFDIDSIGLVNMVQRLNDGLDLGGNPSGSATEYVIGVGANPGAIIPQTELSRFTWKVKAGAEFAITQPVFDVELLFHFLKETAPFRIPIIAGIWPLVSLRNAEFMNNEVPGTKVPEPIMERMRKADKKGKALEEGINIARETIACIRSQVQGIQVSVPFGKIRHPIEVLKI